MVTEENLINLKKDLKKILENSKFGENDFYGNKTKRAYSILAQTRELDNFLINTRLTEIINSLLAPNSLIVLVFLKFKGNK
jgi:hypothetical protein